MGTVLAFSGVRLQQYSAHSTGKAPFEIVEGGKKVPPILHTKDKILKADKYVEDMQESYASVKYALQRTQEKHKKAEHQHRRPLEFALDDWVLLKFEKARFERDEGLRASFSQVEHPILWTFSDIGEDERGILSTQTSSHLENSQCFSCKFT